MGTCKSVLWIYQKPVTPAVCFGVGENYAAATVYQKKPPKSNFCDGNAFKSPSLFLVHSQALQNFVLL